MSELHATNGPRVRAKRRGASTRGRNRGTVTKVVGRKSVHFRYDDSETVIRPMSEVQQWETDASESEEDDDGRATTRSTANGKTAASAALASAPRTPRTASKTHWVQCDACARWSRLLCVDPTFVPVTSTSARLRGDAAAAARRCSSNVDMGPASNLQYGCSPPRTLFFTKHRRLRPGGRNYDSRTPGRAAAPRRCPALGGDQFEIHDNGDVGRVRRDKSNRPDGRAFRPGRPKSARPSPSRRGVMDCESAVLTLSLDRLRALLEFTPHGNRSHHSL